MGNSCFHQHKLATDADLHTPLNGDTKPPNGERRPSQLDIIPQQPNPRKHEYTPPSFKKSMSLTEAVATWKLKHISDHPSYHGNISGREATKILKQHGGTCYLTRYSRKKDRYALSVIQREAEGSEDFIVRSYQLNIYKHSRKRIILEIEGTEQQFDSIFDLLSFYERTPVDHDINDIGTMVVATKKQYFKIRNRGKQRKMEREMSIVEYHLDDIIGERPTLAELTNIKWQNDREETRNFKLTATVCSTWAQAGLLLGINNDTMENFEQKTNDNQRRLEYVLSHWIEQCREHPTYPATWEGLLELLNVLDRSTAADNLRLALERRIE